MPTISNSAPVPPSDSQTVGEAMAYGHKQWQAVWRPFARQWSQPKLIKLAENTLKEKVVHSSQINNFNNGSLRDPAPKVLLAIGRLNLAIAKSNGEDVNGLKCPPSMAELWHGFFWMCNPDGTPMGPADVFLTLAGQVDHGVDFSRQIPQELESEACRSVARYLRLTLAKNGCDWMDELQRLKKFSPISEILLMGGIVAGDFLVRELDNLGKMIGQKGDTIWTTCLHSLVKVTA